MDAAGMTEVAVVDVAEAVAMAGVAESTQEPTDAEAARLSLPASVVRGGVTTQKLAHRNMILDGVCTHCAHCGHELTDSVSIQRGIGPVCSKKGYEEEMPENADEMQAMIALSEYKELVDFLMREYRPLGLRGLVNGLVRVASLNRPRGRGQCEGNADLFDAICDAIDALGHEKLASLLRETLIVVDVKASADKPGYYEVWVKSRVWKREWSEAMQAIYGSSFDKAKRKRYVLIHKEGDEKCLAFTTVDGKRMTNKALLWNAMVRHYEGLVARTPKGVFKIKPLK